MSVDYRLAPEFPYPAAAEDAVEALQWLMKEAPKYYNVDLERVAIGGTSAYLSTSLPRDSPKADCIQRRQCGGRACLRGGVPVPVLQANPDVIGRSCHR